MLVRVSENGAAFLAIAATTLQIHQALPLFTTLNMPWLDKYYQMLFVPAGIFLLGCGCHQLWALLTCRHTELVVPFALAHARKRF